MKTLIVEDDFTSRMLLQEILKNYGLSHIAINGNEAVDAVRLSLEAGEPYDLICMDILMPEMDGQEALKKIRELEEAKGIVSTKGAKILMVTALDNFKSVSTAYGNYCDGYFVKPIEKEKFLKELKGFGLIP